MQYDVEKLKTKRLTLTKPTEADFSDWIRMYADERVMATLGGVRTPAEAREFFDRLVGHWTVFQFGLWILRDAATAAFVGRAGPRLVVLEGKPEAEVGYGLMSEYWGHGLATEVARESLRVGFEVIGFPDMVCFTLPTNTASQRVMQKVGFRYERNGTFLNLPHVIYRIRRDEWEATLSPPANATPEATSGLTARGPSSS